MSFSLYFFFFFRLAVKLSCFVSLKKVAKIKKIDLLFILISCEIACNLTCLSQANGASTPNAFTRFSFLKTYLFSQNLRNVLLFLLAQG